MIERRWVRGAALALTVILTGVLGWLNSGEVVSLDLGFFVLYQTPLVPLFFVAFLLGMVAMYLLGLRHDLRVRRVLQERGLLDPTPAPHRADPPPEPPV